MALQRQSRARFWQLDESQPDDPRLDVPNAYSGDRRRPVEYYKRNPGTQYYSIARLTIQFAYGEGGAGTGFMVNNNILMTAGHCLWNDYGPAARLVASFGQYEVNGRSYWHEHRHGTAVLMSKNLSHSTDFAIVILQDRDPTRDIVPIIPFRWYDTPLQANMLLYITGYPAERNRQCNTMYEGWKSVTWDLLSEGGWLKHGILTFPGQSGSPILLADKQFFIGIHVAGNETASENIGTSTAHIRSPFGPHMIWSYERALRGKVFNLNTPEAEWGAITTYDVAISMHDTGASISYYGEQPALLEY